MHALGMALRPVMFARIGTMAQQRVRAHRRKARLMRPAFEDRALRQRLVEPARRIRAEAREQDEIRTARDDMNGVDLQLLHALDRRELAPTGRARTRRVQQSLRRVV
jgi:hypothetical protein